ncbi:hypothetical protein DV704_00305 [Meiothermus sp. QL-1]|uniref:TapB family protein n=1 Tax=Meiothermus sp. QL-1 TaxID=2058095 RepID=UPI000E0C4947|nr:hypothetical protein [Meiothermus sp. QL-1]RDI96306.1 hypothetical protein DV704_00305 [Meiothermus sp. QL-1]
MRALGFALIFSGLALACTTPFYPTDPSLRWRYRVLNDNQVYTQSFVSNGPNALLERRQFADRTETTPWSCTPQGLQALPQEERPIPGGSVRLTRLAGVVLPSGRWQVGESWTYRYELKGRVAFLEFTGFLEVENRVVARETVVVPAGRFEALRVEATFKGEFGLAFGGRATYWFAEGVGVVKQVSEGSFGGISSELIEFRR